MSLSSDIIRDQQEFLRLYQSSLSDVLKKVIHLKPNSIELMSFSKFEKMITSTSCIGMIDSEDAGRIGMLVFDARLTHRLIDYLLDGTERNFTLIKERDLTRIDLFVIKKVMELAVDDLNQSVFSRSYLKMDSIGSSMNPEIVSEFQQYGNFAVISIKMDFQGVSGTMMLVFPATDTADLEGGHLDWRQQLYGHLQSTDVLVQVHLGGVAITLEDLGNLCPGDIIPLTQDIRGELDIFVENVPKFKGFIGDLNGYRAVRISRIMNHH